MNVSRFDLNAQISSFKLFAYSFNLIKNCLVLGNTFCLSAQSYYGKYLGSFPSRAIHNVGGKVYAVNETSLFIENFSYDGTAPGKM